LALDAGARAPDETALMTTELVPDHADDVPQREREFGASRVACNALWYSDVNAGRIISGATIARLRAEPDFAAVRAENAQSDAAFCAAEAASLRPAPAALR
jgi:acid phosphatase (class A)